MAEFFSSSGENSFRLADVSVGFEKTETERSETVAATAGNKIMIVVDSSLEAKGALEWALIHAVQTQDTIILVHVATPSKPAGELLDIPLLYSEFEILDWELDSRW